MGARMFTAVIPPIEVVEELDAFCQPRREAVPLRWTPPASWHLTTAFMADVGDRHVDRLTEGLAAAAARTEPFGMRLGGAGTFGPPDAGRHLWLGLVEGADALGALSVRCRNAAEHAGVPTDGARFTPHLTLARTNRTTDLRRLLRVLDTFDADGWTADELLLIESHLADRGNRYEVVGRFGLGATGTTSLWGDAPTRHAASAPADTTEAP